jgi:diketogulonate reductase-like aldo/keto reductase
MTIVPVVSTERILLDNGVRMPRLGLGVYRSRKGGGTRRAVLEALRVGYRHVDTARIYDNERGVGEGLVTVRDPRRVP